MNELAPTKMNSKRQLYKPAPKQSVVQKKARTRKLVQGRLVSACPGPAESTEDSTTGGGTNSKQTTTHEPNMSNIIANSMLTDTRDDRIMSPCRSVPALTEQSSPRAEPPSRCLDLSDAELNLSLASITSTMSKQHPIMVCDASHLASSSDNTEVEVIVNYEDSPARVICHTPSRLEKSLLSNSVQSSPRPSASRKIFDTAVSHDFQRDEREVIERRVSRSEFISEHSRGIIKEILAEEIGSKDFDSISLYSHNSSPSYLPRSSSPLNNTSKLHTSSINSNYNSSQSVDNAKDNKGSPKSNDIPKPVSYRQSTFDEDSDASNDENVIRKDRIDRTPKIEAAKAEALRRNQNDSDSETCSLYEYVTQTKNNNNSGQVLRKQSSQKKKANESLDVVKPRFTEKKSSTVVASRYMLSAASDTGNQSSVASMKESSSESSMSRSNTTQNNNTKYKPKIMAAKASLKPATSSGRLLDVSKKSSHSITAGHNNPGKKNAGRLTSTPTHDHSCYPYMDASSINQSSTMAIHTDDKAVLEQQQLELDFQHTRYLQALFMSTKARKSFQEQERQAMKQLNGLWMLREKKRAELSQSKMELDRLKGMLEIDDALEKTEVLIASLEEKIPQVVQDYSKLSLALHNTQHQIATKDMYIPNKTEEERETYEDQLEQALRESERLLGQISAKVGTNSAPLHHYVSSLEAISGNVHESGNELQEGHRNLDVAQGLSSQLLSGMVRAMQNSLH